MHDTPGLSGPIPSHEKAGQSPLWLGARWLLAVFIVLLCLLGCVSRASAAEMTAEEASTRATSTYAAALKYKHVSSFRGSCGMSVNSTLVVLGINTSYVGLDGNKEWDYYSALSTSSGGYSIVTYSAKDYSLKTALEAVAASENNANILVGFQTSNTSAGKIYGHTFFIQAIVDDIVYFCESYDAPWDGTKIAEGNLIAKSIDEVASYYSASTFEGLVQFIDHTYDVALGDTPTLNSASNTADGVFLSWSKTAGAIKYYVYRKAAGESNYTFLGKSQTTTYTDSTAESGVKYSYKIKAVAYDGSKTACSNVKSCTYMASPTVSSIKNTSTGVKITWGTVTGAVKYTVYRKTSGGSYTKVKTTTSTSWTDTTATEGTTYYYKIKAYAASGEASAKGTAATMCRLAATTVKLTNTASGVKVSWSEITGASGYYIYRKTSDGSYSKIQTITGASTISYTDTSVKSKNCTVYVYKVVPYYKNGSGAVYKAAATEMTTVRLTGATLSSVTNASSKSLLVKWSKASSVTGYQIAYSTSADMSGSVKVLVSKRSQVSTTIDGLTKNKTYYVRIRTYKSIDGTKYYSAWSSKSSVKISK